MALSNRGCKHQAKGNSPVESKEHQESEYTGADSEPNAVVEVSAKRKGKQKALAKRKKEKLKQVAPSKIVLFVPQVGSDANRHITLNSGTVFDDALATISENIGYMDVKMKPELSYKLSSAAQKTKPISLAGEDNWEGLVDEIEHLQGKKKQLVPVTISVSEQYLHSLKA